MVETIRESMVTTRKDHTCYMCGRVFPKNTRMKSITVVDDRIETLYSCKSCEEIIEYVDLSVDGVYYEGCVRESLDNILRDAGIETPEDWAQQLRKTNKKLVDRAYV